MGGVLDRPQGVQITKNMTLGSAITRVTLMNGMELAQSAGNIALQEQKHVALSA